MTVKEPAVARPAVTPMVPSQRLEPGVPTVVHDVVQSPGQPLDPTTKAYMEARLARNFLRVPVRLSAAPVPRWLRVGRADYPLEAAADEAAKAAACDSVQNTPGARVDLGPVRVHTDARSAEAARAINARAFTLSPHIVFGAREYQPNTGEGRRLLAHELAHVLQQSGSMVAPSTLQRKPVVGLEGDTGSLAALNDSAEPAVTTGSLTRPSLKGERDLGQTDAGSTTTTESADAPDGSSGAPGVKPSSDLKVEQRVTKEGADATKAVVPSGEVSAEAPEKAEVPESLAELATGNLALIDEELAEHQRWGAASRTVGGAGSGQRAAFIAEAAAGGSGFTKALMQGAGMGAGMKVAEMAVEKGALKLAARVGAQAAKFAPLPAVGAVIGGVISAYELASRDWKATGETIAKFGKGASMYDQLANSIEATSTVIEVATQVLNVIAGVIGAISIAMWVITILTVGIASPLAITLSTIAAGIALASLVLDGINALVLRQLITLFRALHAFTSEADPRDVVVQGSAIGLAASGASGFLGGLGGGFAGGALAERGVHAVSPKKPTTPVPDHPPPPEASGEGPVVKAETTTEGGKEILPSAKSGLPDEADFGALNDLQKEMHEGPFGEMLESERERTQQPPPVAPPGSTWNYKLLETLLRREQMKPSGAQAQHWTKWLASTRDLPIGERMTAEMISQNRSWLQTDPKRPATLLLTDPRGGGTRYFIGNQPADISPQLELPGFESPRMKARYTVEHRFADKFLIPEATRPGSNANLTNLWAGGEARFRAEGIPGQGDWGWQPQASASARQPYQLGLPLIGVPESPRSGARLPTDQRQLSFDFSKLSPNPNQLELFSERPQPQAITRTVVSPPQSTPLPQPDEGLARISDPFGAARAGRAGTQAESAFRRNVHDLSQIVEHVNPQYPAPPGLPQDLVNIQNQILQTLDARAQAEAASTAMAHEQAHHKANEKPLTKMEEKTREAITAIEAHKQAVARRTEANKQKKDNEVNARGVLADYTTRAAKLATITVPMRGFERFTSLASSLPDEPQVLVGAKRGILKMNADSRRFLSQLDRMDNTISQQKASQSERERQIQADAETLAQTDKKAADSGQTLDQANQANQDMSQQNETRLQQASKLRAEAEQTAGTLDVQAQQKKAQAQSLAAALDAWALRHQQARRAALEQTRQRLEDQGYKVTEVRER